MQGRIGGLGPLRKERLARATPITQARSRSDKHIFAVNFRLPEDKTPPRPVIHGMLYAAWIGVTVVFVAILSGGIF